MSNEPTSWDKLSHEQLTALPTHRLYKVYKLMRERRGSMSHDTFESGQIEKSEYDTWNNKCEFVKTELGTREHIDREKQAPNCGQSKKHNRDYWLGWTPAPAPKRQGPIEDAESCIGKQVYKVSKKPFKSKNFYNTVKAVTVNPHTKLKAFSFEEDTSIVDVHICNMRN